MSKFIRFFIAFTALLAAVACDPDLLASGGIGGTGISSGPITGFGSVFVNGIEWDTSETEFEIDGFTGIEDDLEIGMMVVIEGEFSKDGTRGVARSLRYDDEIEGPIMDVTPVGGDGLVKQILVLGRKILVERGVTRFDDDDPSFTFESIDRDDVVEVSGYLEESGTIVATFIERKGRSAPGSTEVELKGVIQGTGADTFDLGSVTVHFDPTGAATDLSELPGGVRDGIRVEVEGILRSDGDVDAEKIELEDDLGGGDDDLDKLNLEGLVSDFNGLNDFRVRGQPVNATNAEFEQGAARQVANGIRVRVEGPRVDGILRAEKVELRVDELRVQAAVADDADVDPDAGTLRLLGIRITVNSGTRMNDDRDDIPRFSLADVEAGDVLEVRGMSDGAGGIIATLLERNAEEKIGLQGFVEAVDRNDSIITVLGVRVETRPSDTKFESENLGDLDRDQFFLVVRAGDLVSVEDEDDGDPTAIDFADEIEIERAAPLPSAGLAGPTPDLAEAAAADDGDPSRSSAAEMVRTVRLYFDTVEERAKEAREPQ